MALLWQTKSGAMVSVPGVQLRTRRPFRLTLSFVIAIAVAGILLFQLVSQIHDGVCGGPSFLAGTGLCTSILQGRWNLFYHLGGNGPWIRRREGLHYYDALLPKKCSVDQVHMVGDADRRSARWSYTDTYLRSCHGMRNDIPPRTPAEVSHFP